MSDKIVSIDGEEVTVEEMVLSSALFLERLRKEIGWIDVKNELPNLHEDVLVCNGHEMWVTQRIPGWYGNGGLSITHWMPLPEPPTGER